MAATDPPYDPKTIIQQIRLTAAELQGVINGLRDSDRSALLAFFKKLESGGAITDDSMVESLVNLELAAEYFYEQGRILPSGAPGSSQ